MKKTELIEKMAEKTGLTKKDCELAEKALIETIVETVSAGDSISFTGFGKFTSSERSARVGRNPKTGEKIQISARRVPLFKAGKNFKETVNK